MSRKNRGNKPIRHLNGKQRPRSWHHSANAGRAQQKKLDAVAPAFEAAEQDRVEVARISKAHRREVADYEQLIVGLDRVTPFVPAPLPSL